MADTPRPADVAEERAARLAHGRLMWSQNVNGYATPWERLTEAQRDGWRELVRDITHAAGLLATPPADVTERAREEAEREYGTVGGNHVPHLRRAFVAGAEWAAARHTSDAEAGARALDDFAATWVSDWSGDLVPRATVKHALRDRAAALRAGGGV